ncbi:hypothetical protein AADEFJLK_02709 [Methylovulum psychrotolerans]|uniref:Uncharacterized protein n=1 Tax=Methylovulum psychrotolerans TaxID=1704499 RepID=A0A2S5CKC7_9GAMM|nr:hypothetical protein AADEFJLK_02709 [Methylovulum psychrotolerans]
MANESGPQNDVKYCPACKGTLRNIPREEMTSRGHIRADGTVSPHTHTYQCIDQNCNIRFEINQQR